MPFEATQKFETPTKRVKEKREREIKNDGTS